MNDTDKELDILFAEAARVAPDAEFGKRLFARLSDADKHAIKNVLNAPVPSSYYKQTILHSMKKYLYVGIPALIVVIALGGFALKGKNPTAQVTAPLSDESSQPATASAAQPTMKPVTSQSSIDDITSGFIVDADADSADANTESAEVDAVNAQYSDATSIGAESYENTI